MMINNATFASENHPLTELLYEEIKAASGSISFAHFMRQALYHPTFGYYNQKHFHLGHGGDFTTAPELSSLFSQTLSIQCAQILRQLSCASILELGAGSGRMAKDILIALEAEKILPEKYYILEISPALRQKQAAFLQEHCPHLLPNIIWVHEPPPDFTGIIIANEVLDALPVHCFSLENGTIFERRVSYDANGFIWRHEINPELQPYFQEHSILQSLPDQYQSEINLELPILIRDLAKTLKKGVMLFFDYGYGEREYYHPERYTGTLTCFYQHQRNHNPLIRVGLQDITAHVNFTEVAKASVENELAVAGFTTQTNFLLACGMMEHLSHYEKNLNEKEKINLHSAIKKLIFPSEMGETVKAIALTKAFDTELVGFKCGSRIRDL